MSATVKGAPCDVKECKKTWCIVTYIRAEDIAPDASGPRLSKKPSPVKHSVKLCAEHYKEFRSGKTPTLRG